MRVQDGLVVSIAAVSRSLRARPDPGIGVADAKLAGPAGDDELSLPPPMVVTSV
jgi:hypothetical protein